LGNPKPDELAKVRLVWELSEGIRIQVSACIASYTSIIPKGGKRLASKGFPIRGSLFFIGFIWRIKMI